jgi:hypothetical protein
LLVDDERAADVHPLDGVEIIEVKIDKGSGMIDPCGMDDYVDMFQAVLGSVEEPA